MATEKALRWSAPPEGPVDLATVLHRFPTLRQSLAANFDDCELGALFGMKYTNGWSTHAQAQGTIFHRFAAECLRVMQEQDTEQIPVGVAMSIFEETLYQHPIRHEGDRMGVAPEDIVRIPFRELPTLEMAARKWAADNHFTVRNIRAIERRITKPLMVPHWETGELYERQLTGELDALIARPPDEAVVLDWKSTWALPPERDEDADEPGISYHGYFQQMFYAWLVFNEYPAVQAVTLREFYVRRTKARPARIHRSELPKIEQRLRYLVSHIDRALASGQPKNYALATLEEHGSWKPTPGKHCYWCAKSHLCPIDEDYRNAGVDTPEAAQRVVGIRTKAEATRKWADRMLKPWVELHGSIPIKWSKGTRVLGFRRIAGGKVRWGEYTPQEADMAPPRDDVSPDLEGAMRAAVARAREERDRRAA